MQPKRLLVCPRRCRNPPGGAVLPLDAAVLADVSTKQFYVLHKEPTIGRTRSDYLLLAVGVALIVLHGVWFGEQRQVSRNRWSRRHLQGSLLCRPGPYSRRTNRP